MQAPPQASDLATLGADVEWPDSDLATAMQKTLAEFCDRTDILNKDAVMHLVREQRDPRSWYLFNLALWWKHYIA